MTATKKASGKPITEITKSPSGPAIVATKKGTCKTLNGKSSLEYSFGADTEGRGYLSITGNSGGGFFSDEWVACADILNALSKADPVTSLPLRRLFQGRSVNTPGFLLAVLLHEKVVAHLPGKTKLFQLLDTTAFLDKVQTLQSSTSKGPAKKPASAKVPANKTQAKTTRAK